MLPNEQERQEVINSLEFLQQQADSQVKDIAQLTAKFCDIPIVLVTIVNETRQNFYVQYGLSGDSTSRDESFCGHTILQDDLFEVNNAQEDVRFHDNPLVSGDPNIVYYAGHPIRVKGHKIGALCMIDRKPRDLSPLQKEFHLIMTHQVEQIFSQKAFVEGYLSILNKLELTSSMLEDNLKKFRDVISAISHDAIAPVRSLKSLVDISKEDETVDFRYFLEDIDKSLLSSESLLTNLIKWGVNLADAKDQDVASFDIAEMMSAIAFELRPEVDLKRNRVELEGNPVSISVDEHKFRFIIRNLIKNSNKFTDDGLIRIKWWEDSGKLWISVKDTGVGMDAEMLAKLNDNRELESNEGTRGEKGFGLGLRLIFSFVDSLGGEMKIDSEPGEGTVCTLSLPRL